MEFTNKFTFKPALVRIFSKKLQISYKKGLRGLIVGHRKCFTGGATARLVGRLIKVSVCCLRIQRHHGRVASVNIWRGRFVLSSTLFENLIH